MRLLTGDDARAFMEAAQQMRAEANASVTLEQVDQAVVGACYIRFAPDIPLVIYGEIIDHKYEEDRLLFESEHMRYVRPTMNYSVIEPTGELGNVHIACMHLFITRQQFEAARAANWPHDKEVASEILNLKLMP